MFHKINLREMAQISAPERAFLSLYLSRPKALDSLDRRVKNARAMLKDNKDEAEYFEENLKLVRDYLKDNPLESGGLAVFACWALDFFRAYPLELDGSARGQARHPAGPTLTKLISASEPESATPGAGADLMIVDSSPYIRPLAEMQDEYENFAVVVADNKCARIFLVTSSTREPEGQICGNIKNHVKKGGWSQQRYERRRDKQLHIYAKEIADKLAELEQSEIFRRVLMVGSKETLDEIRRVLPDQVLRKLSGEKAVDLHKGTQWVNREIFDLFFIEERRSEQELWEQIKGEYLRKGLASVGAEDVLEAAKTGRIRKVVITRNARIDGFRCRDCEHLSLGSPQACPNCKSQSLFKVDLVNEIVEILAKTKAEADFVDPIPGLSEVGDIAALLRY